MSDLTGRKRFDHALLAQARRGLGISQQEVADAIGIEVRTYRRYETGEYNGPQGFVVGTAQREQTIGRLCAYLGLERAQLIVDVPHAAGWTPRIEHELQPARRFVGRQDRLNALHAWATAERPAHRVLSVVAVGGSGKTALAHRCGATPNRRGRGACRTRRPCWTMCRPS